MSSYSVIQPPFTLEFAEMTREELGDYKAWFLASVPERTKEMSRALTATLGFEAWLPDHSLGSLDTLGRWFEGQVATRTRSSDETDELRAGLVFPTDVPTRELTNRTFSLAMDIGMYLGETIRQTVPAATWKQPRGGKRFADYGQMVVGGLGPLDLNPVRICVVLAYGISRGTRDGTRLRALHDYWTGQ